MRPRGLSVNTMRTRLRAIALGLSFLVTRQIEWPSRVLGGKFLDYSETLTLFEQCRVDRRTGTRLVDPTAAHYGYRSIIHYLVWLSRPLVGAISNPDRQISVNISLEHFTSMALGFAVDRPDQPLKDIEGRGLRKDQRELFQSAITPGTENNPFLSIHQHRNYALLMLQYCLGCREGEILSLKIRDIDFSATPTTVTIHRRHDDPEDPRRRQPVAKTRARLLEIGDDLSDILRTWILEHRSNRKNYPLARKHPFIAVNRFGAPLSSSGYERIFHVLRKRHPMLRDIASHLLRHDWNDRFLTLAEELATDPIEVERDQIYAMGWSDHSKMPLRYGRRAIRRSTGKKMLKMQNKALGGDQK